MSRTKKKAQEEHGCPTTLIGSAEVDYLIGEISDVLQALSDHQA
jgi:hypothetical protein